MRPPAALIVEWSMLTRARKLARRIRASSRNLSARDNHVYVVLLRGFGRDGTEIGFYIGQSAYPPEERFAQHKAGIRSSGVVRRMGERLLPKVYKHLNPLSEVEAKQIEAGLAEAFRAAGLPNVRGGH
ncbi:MAG: hypothetical protein ACK4SZ_03025 [Allosphingosinicella sp.]|uniref:hypothetical protein n=1 Tax=Allosphingosinicella sp. TaxID=2823234 RepID=UPI00395F6643